LRTRNWYQVASPAPRPRPKRRGIILSLFISIVTAERKGIIEWFMQCNSGTRVSDLSSRSGYTRSPPSRIACVTRRKSRIGKPFYAISVCCTCYDFALSDWQRRQQRVGTRMPLDPTGFVQSPPRAFPALPSPHLSALSHLSAARSVLLSALCSLLSALCSLLSALCSLLSALCSQI
jgi:hypothetical protein